MLLTGLGAGWARPVERTARPGALNRAGFLPTVSFLLLSVVQILATSRDARMGTLSIGVGAVGVLLAYRGSVLRRSNVALRHDSRTDPLMGIANRLQLADDLREADERARAGEPYGVALFDLDRFKIYNDRLGHQAGDLALQAVALLLDGSSREGDRVYRYGGEELLMLLRSGDITQAAQIVERLRSELEQAALAHPGNEPYPVMTVSAGVACVRDGESPEQVTQRADEALYRAKEAGRNRVLASGRPLGEEVPQIRNQDQARPPGGGTPSREPRQPHA
jgi:diguanylate cyclase (GGDEF)-like protein